MFMANLYKQNTIGNIDRIEKKVTKNFLAPNDLQEINFIFI